MTGPTPIDPQTPRHKNRSLDEFQAMLKQLPMSQRLVAYALLAGEHAPTYRQVAALLGIHRGTLNQHLRRIRLLRPHIYGALMEHRGRQLSERHVRSLQREDARSQRWRRARVSRRFAMKRDG